MTVKKPRFFNYFLLSLLLTFSIMVDCQAKNKPPIEKINVFAIVSDNIENAFLTAANTLKKEQGLDSFPLQGFQVHCTLYMTHYQKEMKEKILTKVREIANNTKQFEISTAGLEITSGNWFFMKLKLNHSLQALSDTVVAALSPLRFQANFIPDWAKAFPNKVELIKKFGSPNVYEEFNPHLTFLARGEVKKLQNFMENHNESYFAKPITGKVVAIGVGIADHNGQIPEVWQIFKLQSCK